MRGGVIVLNTEFAIQVWNHNAENLWGLRTEEALGKNFLNLETGLPMERLAPTLLACLSGESVKQEMTVRAFNRRGKSIECSITCTPLLKSRSSEITGVILVMEETAVTDNG